MRKKKVFIHSDYSLAKTGFGRTMKALILHLYKTGKYEIVHYCCGMNESNPALSKTPWKSRGCLPDSQQEIDNINRDPVLARDAGYGGYFIDKAIREEKPDVYIGSQDIWAFPNYHKKYWWNKIPCAIWTTLDSLPILPAAIEAAKDIKNYWIWSSFATKELNKIGHPHVKTVHGPIDDSFFYKLPEAKRKELRARFNIPEDCFLSLFVFRNQLRKQVPQLLEGFSLFKKSNPDCKDSKLLLHTSYSEGWNINRIASEYKIPLSDILTTYICKSCNNYEIKSFCGEEQKCPCCGAEKSCSTTNVAKGVTEVQLNEIYNLADMYFQPISSGGQEIPVLEAKFCELITAVTNYSCGEELCEEGSGSLILDWSEYREFQTEFRKSSTNPSSIAKQMAKVFKMPKQKRQELGKQAREWALKNYSINVIGKAFEEFLDNIPVTSYNFTEVKEDKDPNAIIPEIEDDGEWVKCLYKKILKMDVDENDQGYIHWTTVLKNS